MDSAVKVTLEAKRECDAAPGGAPGVLRLWSALREPESAVVLLKEVIAVIRPQRWQATKQRLQRLGVPAYTHQRVVGRGRERGLRYLPRSGAAAQTAVRYLPKRMISWIVEAQQVDGVVQAVMDVNRTGCIGDGIVLVAPVAGAIRIRTGEAGAEALRPERRGDWIAGTLFQDATEEAHAARRESD